MRTSGAALSLLPVSFMASGGTDSAYSETRDQKGVQRLSMERLKDWQTWGYGMFIHFGMSTYSGVELPTVRYPDETYHPSELDVSQWVSVARDAGMKYAVLCAKHVAGHCLWPSRHTDYTVANSPVTTDVVGEFTRQCREKGLKGGLYYCSMDNVHTYGSLMPETRLPDGRKVPWYGGGRIPGRDEVLAYTTSLYQNFMTAQIDELIGDYGLIDELWIDIPTILGTGYRSWLYERIARISPETYILMNNGMGFDGRNYYPEEYFPQDLISLERGLRSESYNGWWSIHGQDYYIPAEVCDPIGRDWFWTENDRPREAGEIAGIYRDCREKGMNFLLDVPPNRDGLIPEESIKRLMEVRQLIF
jgi:alpha-L-fucosidase